MCKSIHRGEPLQAGHLKLSKMIPVRVLPAVSVCAPERDTCVVGPRGYDTTRVWRSCNNRTCCTCAANMLLQPMSRFNAKPCAVRPPAVDAADRQGAEGVCIRGELPRHRPLHPWCALASYCKQQSPAQAGSPPPRLLQRLGNQLLFIAAVWSDGTAHPWTPGRM